MGAYHQSRRANKTHIYRFMGVKHDSKHFGRGRHPSCGVQGNRKDHHVKRVKEFSEDRLPKKAILFSRLQKRLKKGC
eukprot:c38977_g1_i1 orf=36-266(+)